jgi:CRP-like cAMP-binding protein
MGHIEGLDRLLKEHPFFSDMAPEACEVIAGCAANELFQAGEYILREGRPADKFYVIRHGAVALEIHVPGREPLMVETLQEGDILGWAWLMPPYTWNGDGRATQLTRVVSLDAKCLRGKLETDHSLGYELFKRFIPVIAARLSAARLQLADLYGQPSKAKS